jgi:hypothetical protein
MVRKLAGHEPGHFPGGHLGPAAFADDQDPRRMGLAHG